MATIQNGCNVPLNVQTGTIPQLDGAMADWFQPLSFVPVRKTATAFQVIETGDPVHFRGVVMPLHGRKLEIKMEGERAWNWISIFSQSVLPLAPDDVIIFLDKQYRVMTEKNYSLYSYIEYQLVLDWTGSGPRL